MACRTRRRDLRGRTQQCAGDAAYFTHAPHAVALRLWEYTMHMEDARHRMDVGGAVGVHDRCPGGLMLCGRWVNGG